MYENSAITDQGRALVAACMAAGHSIEFTSYTLGAGTYSDAEKDPDNLRTLTALKNQKQTFPFVGVGSSSGNECILNIQVDNDGLSTGYYMTEAGVWAKDGDDPSSTPILYQIGVDDNPSYMPDEDTSPLAIDTECHTAIAAAANFTFTFVHGAYAWASDLGDINDLHTTNKDSAVDAINEVRDEVRPISRGGTGFSYAFDALNNLGGVQLGATATKNTDSQVATSDYLGGKIFCKDGYLYKATKKIAIGDTIYLTGVNKNAKMVLLADEVSDSVGKEALADYTENEFKATRNYHTVGVYIYIRATRELYKTTVSIDYDETLDTSTNIEQATVGGELARLSSDLTNIQKSRIATTSFIDISSYSSSTNPYTCPDDGYARVSSNGDAIKLLTYDTSAPVDFISSTGNIVAVFVRKGTKLVAAGSSSRFIQLL